jgi:long-chain acyl-CoA synthetase
MEWAEVESSFEHEFLREDTLPRMFERSAERRPDDTAQMYKGGVYGRSLTPDVVTPAPDGDYASLSYGEMRDVVRNLAAGFREVGLRRGDRVGIFAQTRMEWAHADFALLAAGGVVTTVYRSSSPEQVQYLLGDSGATGVVVENGELLERVLTVEGALDLDFVVVMDELDGEHARYADREDVHTLADVHELGRAAFDRETYEGWLDGTAYEDLATLVYTSGTTGQPKGVKLTHQNVRSNLNQAFRRYGPRPDRDPETPTVDKHLRALSYLPLAHIFERNSGHFLLFGLGATVAYAESADTLTEDLPLVEPSAMVNVPRIFERIYDGMREEAAESGVKLRIFEWAMGVARRYHRMGGTGLSLQLRHRLADRLVYSKVKEGMGGEMEVLISGGGTLSKDLAELFQGMGVEIYEGYGMTEASPIVTTNPPEAAKPGTIGPPLLGVETDVDMSIVPEGELTNTMGDLGELLVKGPNVSEGYWNKPGKTDDAFLDREDGRWFRTGDIVTVRPDDYLVFHERSKQMLVLSTGKNVAPQPIEEQVTDDPLVEQCMVVGNERKFVGALVVPNLEAVANWADRVGLDLPDDPDAVCTDERVAERIRQVVDEVNQQFEPHEQIGDVRLLAEEFSEDNDMLTPTLKKKRRNIRETYADEIESIYGDDRAAEERVPAAED